jgi:hypothetical protein
LLVRAAADEALVSLIPASGEGGAAYGLIRTSFRLTPTGSGYTEEEIKPLVPPPPECPTDPSIASPGADFTLVGVAIDTTLAPTCIMEHLLVAVVRFDAASLMNDPDIDVTSAQLSVSQELLRGSPGDPFRPDSCIGTHSNTVLVRDNDTGRLLGADGDLPGPRWNLTKAVKKVIESGAMPEVWIQSAGSLAHRNGLHECVSRVTHATLDIRFLDASPPPTQLDVVQGPGVMDVLPPPSGNSVDRQSVDLIVEKTPTPTGSRSKPDIAPGRGLSDVLRDLGTPTPTTTPTKR